MASADSSVTSPKDRHWAGGRANCSSQDATVLNIETLTEKNGYYYLRDLASELGAVLGPDGITGWEPGQPGRWLGDGAAELGLAGPVGSGDLAAVLQGKRPLLEKGGPGRPRTVTAYDLVFSSPKGVSLILAVGGPAVAREVLSAHLDAVNAAMEYVERRGMGVWRLPIENGTHLVPANGLIGAAFTHGVSRAFDPHLHTHVLVANAARGQDGRWTALNGRSLFYHSRAAGGLYLAHLRHNLSVSLKAEWEGQGTGHYDLVGIDRLVIGGFSTRRNDIRAHLAENQSVRLDGKGPGRRASRKQANLAALVTRPKKESEHSLDDLLRNWWEKADGLGFGRQELSAVIDRSPGTQLVINEETFASRLRRLPVLTRHDAIGAWTGALAQGAPADEVERCVDLLADWGGRSGPVERQHSVDKVRPTRYQLLALGNRPASPDQLAVWLDAAKAIEKYRDAWTIKDPDRALGSEEWRRESTSTRKSSREFILQLADHHDVSREIKNARRQLGREREGPELGLSR
jgi:conjugative relaxase-like TrwC/TraI family protein